MSKNKPTERYQTILAYDGTQYHGSQRQSPEIATVQGAVEKALRTLDWQGQSVLFAGRTDTGVHALGQVIAFDLAWNHSPTDLQRALNANLPADIAVMSVKRASVDFHPRFDASARRYFYRIYCSPNRDPLREHYAWRVWPSLAIERLRTASQFLLGVHDFAAFGSPHKPGGSTIREILSVSWQQEKEEYFFEILGNAFLYHMVRHIVQLLVVIGQKKEKIDVVEKYLLSPSGKPVPGLVPAQGLILKEVVY